MQMMNELNKCTKSYAHVMAGVIHLKRKNKTVLKLLDIKNILKILNMTSRHLIKISELIYKIDFESRSE